MSPADTPIRACWTAFEVPILFKSLAEGQKVEFVVVQGQKGPAAEGVTPI